MTPSDVPTRTIHGTSVPLLGLGTWRLSGAACTHVVTEALDMGYRHVDTAQYYENEAAVGRGLAEADVDRDDVFVVTKVPPSRYQQEAFLPSVRESLDALGVEAVDLLLLHWPHRSVNERRTFDLLAEARAEGLARHVGLSNYPPSTVEAAREHVDVFCNQVEYHPFRSQEALLEQADRYGYLLTAYSPLAKGQVMDDEPLQQIAARHDATAAQVALAWLMQQGVAAIPKASSTDHLRDNLEATRLSLTDEEMETIHGRARDLHLDPVSRMSDEAAARQ
jgi:2,5-diketo-D-gluconate reductase B